MTSMTDTCEQRIEGAMRGRLEDFAEFLTREDRASATDNDDKREENRERWDEYPLHVSQTKLYTILLSTGGPHDEFEVEVDDEGTVQAIRYRFKDWYDGAMRELSPSSPEFETAERFLREFIPETY